MTERNDYYNLKGKMHDLKNCMREAEAFLAMIKNMDSDSSKEEQSIYYYFSDDMISQKLASVELTGSEPFIKIKEYSRIDNEVIQRQVCYFLEGIRLATVSMNCLLNKIKSANGIIDNLLSNSEYEVLREYKKFIFSTLLNLTTIRNEVIDGLIFLNGQAKKLGRIDSCIENITDIESLTPLVKEHPNWIKIFYRIGFVDLKTVNGKYILKAKKNLLNHLYSYVKDYMTFKTFCSNFVDENNNPINVKSTCNNWSNNFPENLRKQLDLYFSCS